MSSDFLQFYVRHLPAKRTPSEKLISSNSCGWHSSKHSSREPRHAAEAPWYPSLIASQAEHWEQIGVDAWSRLTGAVLLLSVFFFFSFWRLRTLIISRSLFLFFDTIKVCVMSDSKKFFFFFCISRTIHSKQHLHTLHSTNTTFRSLRSN